MGKMRIREMGIPKRRSERGGKKVVQGLQKSALVFAGDRMRRGKRRKVRFAIYGAGKIKGGLVCVC